MYRLLTSSLENDGNNKAVNTENTSHNNGNEGLEDEVRLQNTDGGDTNTSLGGTVGSTQVAEDEGTSDSHKSEEGVLVGVVSGYRKQIQFNKMTEMSKASAVS